MRLSGQAQSGPRCKATVQLSCLQEMWLQKCGYKFTVSALAATKRSANVPTADSAQYSFALTLHDLKDSSLQPATKTVSSRIGVSGDPDTGCLALLLQAPEFPLVRVIKLHVAKKLERQPAVTCLLSTHLQPARYSCANKCPWNGCCASHFRRHGFTTSLACVTSAQAKSVPQSVLERTRSRRRHPQLCSFSVFQIIFRRACARLRDDPRSGVTWQALSTQQTDFHGAQ